MYKHISTAIVASLLCAVKVGTLITLALGTFSKTTIEAQQLQAKKHTIVCSRIHTINHKDTLASAIIHKKPSLYPFKPSTLALHSANNCMVSMHVNR